MATEITLRPFSEIFLIPLRNGLTRPTAVRGEGVKMVNMGEIFAHSRIKDIDMDRVPLSEEEAQRYLLESGDLLFARQSLVLSGAGKCSIFLGDSEPVTFEGHLIRARLNPDLADPLYYYYFFNSMIGRGTIESIVEQVAAAGIRASDLAKLRVPYLPLNDQRAIARVLGSLDNKIELNRRMNTTLEETARAIFQSWFVNFDPVRAKAEDRTPTGLDADTAVLFPDGFEDVEGRAVPRGWAVGKLDHVSENIRRNVEPSQIDPQTPYIGLEHMPRKQIALDMWDDASKLESNKFQFKQGEILFGKLRPYFHKVGVAPTDGVCSTDIVVVKPTRTVWFGFLLGHISSPEFVAYTNSSSDGTKMPRTSWKDMARYEIVIPTENIAEIYNSIITSFVDQIIANIHASRTLAILRDTLLPKLLSGEVRVKDVEIFLEQPS